MAEGEPTPQNLYEFTNNLLEDLTSGAITPEEALVALEQYGYLRDILTQSTSALAGSLTNTETFTNELRMLVDRARGLLNQSLPQLRRTPPDALLPPAEIAARAQSFARARGIFTETLTNRQNHLASTHRAFVTALVTNWIEQSRGSMSAEQAQTGANLIESTLGAALASNTDPDRSISQVRRTLEKSMPRAPATLDAAYREVAATRQMLIDETAALSRIATAPGIILTHPEVRRTDWFTGVLLEQLSTSASPVSRVEQASAKLAKTAEIISSPPPAAELLGRSGGIFQSFAQTGMQKALAGVADGVFVFLGPETRDRVLQIVLSKTAQRVLADTDSLTKRLGETFVDSPVFAEIKQKLQETIVTPRDGASPLVKTKSLIGDLFTTIVGSPIGERMVGSPREAIYTYLETLQLNAAFPAERRFWPSVLPFSPTWQYLYIVSLFASPGTYYQPGTPLPGPTSAGAPGAGGFGRFLLGTTAGLGGVLSAPFSWLGGGPGGGLLGLFNRGVESLFGSTLLSRWIGDARRRAGTPTRLTDDLPLMVALVVVVSIVILFVLPTFLNFSYVSQLSKTSALLCSRFTGGAYCGGGGPEGLPGRGPFPPADYFDYTALASREFGCISYGGGITTSAGTSQPLTGDQQQKTEAAIAAYPQIKLMSCSLGCPQNQINITAFARDDSYAGYAPSGRAGNIIFYPRAFGFGTGDFAGLLAHELAHNIDWLNGSIFDNFRDQVYCGKLGTYPWNEDQDETFAEAVRLYMIGDPLIRSYCDGRAFNYFNELFSQCR
ncbi:hypothetical protein HY410_01915 [Candidatus Gottesmanbacteria bacterium]|nr:hypothetical protein [Candidatus Gottesmanbacteria bacterium]